MTRAFKKFGQALFLAIVVFGVAGRSAQAQQPTATTSPGYSISAPITGYRYDGGYYGPGYYRFSSGNSLDNSPAYYSYGLGFPVNGSYTSGYYPYYYGTSSAITPAFYSEAGLLTNKSVLTDRTAHVRVIVPDANADVLIDGKRTNTVGMIREYQSPSLADGKYTYEIKATWVENGQSKSKTQKIRVMPGSWSVVNFPESSTAQ